MLRELVWVQTLPLTLRQRWKFIYLQGHREIQIGSDQQLAPAFSFPQSPFQHTQYRTEVRFPQGQTSMHSGAPRSLLLLLQRPNLEKLVLRPMNHEMLQLLRVSKSGPWAPLLEITNCFAFIVLPPGELVLGHSITVNATGYIQLGKWDLHKNLVLLKGTLFGWGWGGGNRQLYSKKQKLRLTELRL